VGLTPWRSGVLAGRRTLDVSLRSAVGPGAVASGSVSPPLGGVWEGVFHGGRGDQAVRLMFLPRGERAFAGTMWMERREMGPVEDGRSSSDSLWFRVMNFTMRAARSKDPMAVQLAIPNGRTHDIEVHFATADTTGPAPTPAAAATLPIVPWTLVPDSILASHAVPLAPVSTPAPELAKGTLLLVGGGPSQSDLDAEFLQLAGGSAARIVVIPTASFMPGDSASMRDPSRWGRGYGAHVAVLHAFSRREADSEEFVKPLRDATGVWMTGGEAELLIVSYLGTRTERELKAL